MCLGDGSEAICEDDTDGGCLVEALAQASRRHEELGTLIEVLRDHTLYTSYCRGSASMTPGGSVFVSIHWFAASRSLRNQRERMCRYILC